MATKLANPAPQPSGGQIPIWTLGDRMAKALDHAGIGVQEMADYLGVARNTVSTWIHDRIRPSQQTLMLWAFRTGVDLVWITQDQPEPVRHGRRSTGWFHGRRGISAAVRPLTRRMRPGPTARRAPDPAVAGFPRPRQESTAPHITARRPATVRTGGAP